MSIGRLAVVTLLVFIVTAIYFISKPEQELPLVRFMGWEPKGTDTWEAHAIDVATGAEMTVEVRMLPDKSFTYTVREQCTTIVNGKEAFMDGVFYTTTWQRGTTESKSTGCDGYTFSDENQSAWDIVFGLPNHVALDLGLASN